MDEKILNTHSDYFELLLDEIDIFEQFTNNFKSLNINSENITRYQITSIFYLYKSTNLLLSIDILLRNGQSDTSKILVRSLVELAFNYEYLSKDIDNNIDKFWHHPTISAYFTFTKFLKNNKTSPGLKEGISNLLPKFEESYRKNKSLYSLDKKDEIKNNEKYNWTGLSIYALANELNRTDMYTQYYIFSDVTHSNASQIQDYLNFDKHEFDFSNNSDEIPYLILSSCQLYNIVIDLVNQCFDLSLNDKIKSFENRFRVLDSKLSTDIL